MIIVILIGVGSLICVVVVFVVVAVLTIESILTGSSTNL